MEHYEETTASVVFTVVVVPVSRFLIQILFSFFVLTTSLIKVKSVHTKVLTQYEANLDNGVSVLQLFANL